MNFVFLGDLIVLHRLHQQVCSEARSVLDDPQWSTSRTDVSRILWLQKRLNCMIPLAIKRLSYVPVLVSRIRLFFARYRSTTSRASSVANPRMTRFSNSRRGFPRVITPISLSTRVVNEWSVHD